MTATLERPLKTEDFKRAVEEYETHVTAQIQEKIAGLTDEVRTLITDLFEEQKKAIVARMLPTLDEPDGVEFKVRQLDGVARTVDSPQTALLLNGKGREMQLVLTWKGQAQ